MSTGADQPTRPHSFSSDNTAGAHPHVLDALIAANSGHAPAYGADQLTARVQELFAAHFGPGTEAFPVFNGTGANVTTIAAVSEPHTSVICTDVAHMNLDECGAPERLAGTKILAVPAEDGKLTPDVLRRWDYRRGDVHFAQPTAVSITQPTELGTIYSPAETRAIADAAHERNMVLHIDGARLANAAVALDLSLRALTTDLGVDIVSFGGTKNGLLFGEAVVCLRQVPSAFPFVRKQLGQLASKMRFLSAQFIALLEGDLWLQNARNANQMAERLATGVTALGIPVLYPVQSNAVFASLDRPTISRLTALPPGDILDSMWDEREGVFRWMGAWDTTSTDVDTFVETLAAAINGPGSVDLRIGNPQ